MNELDEVINDYNTHPGLRLAHHPSHNRIKDLYLMHDYMRELGDLMTEAEEATKFIFGPSTPETVYLELSKKHRNRLRKNLLGAE